MASIVLKTSIVQIINIAPSTSLDQLRTLFGHIGPIDKLVLYPEEDKGESFSKVGYIRFKDMEYAGAALHLNNTVFLDRALVVLPLADDLDQVPEESFANLVRAPMFTTAGVPPRSAEWPVDVISLVVGKPGEQVIMTMDPRLATMGLPPYPSLPATTDSSKIEEIRRTVLVTNLDQATTAEQVLDFFGVHAEVRFVRVADNDSERAAYVEFTNQKDVAKAFQLMGATLNNKQIMVQHSTTPITKLPTLVGTSFEEAAKRVKEAEYLISGSVDKMYNSRSRSRSKRRSRSRHRTSRSRRSRSRNGARSSRSRRKSRSKDVKSSRSRLRSRSKDKRTSRSRLSPSKDVRSSRRRSRSKTDRSRRSKSRDKKPVQSRRGSKSRDRRKSRSKSSKRERNKVDGQRKDRSEIKERSSDKEKRENREKHKGEDIEKKKENSKDAEISSIKDNEKEDSVVEKDEADVAIENNSESKDVLKNGVAADQKNGENEEDNLEKNDAISCELSKKELTETQKDKGTDRKDRDNNKSERHRDGKKSDRDRHEKDMEKERDGKRGDKDRDRTRSDRQRDKSKSEKDKSRSLREETRKRSRSRDKSDRKRSRERKRSRDRSKERKLKDDSKDKRSRDQKDKSDEPKRHKERSKDTEKRRSKERTVEKIDQPKEEENNTSKPSESRKRTHEPDVILDVSNIDSINTSVEENISESPEQKRILMADPQDSSEIQNSFTSDKSVVSGNPDATGDNNSDMEMDIDDDSNDNIAHDTSLSNGVEGDNDSSKTFPEYDEFDPPLVQSSKPIKQPAV